jgi:uncharacterized protein
MNIQHEDNLKKGRFFVFDNNQTLAEMTYTWVGSDRIIIDHTEVSDVLRGQQAGKKLVMQAVDYARAKGIKIMPLCPFADSVFKKTPEIQDVLW